MGYNVKVPPKVLDASKLPELKENGKGSEFSGNNHMSFSQCWFTNRTESVEMNDKTRKRGPQKYI